MKFGANTFIWVSPFRTETFDVVQRVADLGFDVIEFAVEQPDLIDIKKLKSIVKKNELEVAICGAFGPDRDLISEELEKRENSKRYVKRCLDYANELEAPIFCGPAYSAVGKTYLATPEQKKADWNRAIEGLRELGDYAQTRGVTLALETLNRFETSFLNIAADLKKLIKDVNHPAIKGHLDTFHMNIEEKHLGEAIELIGDDLVHFHTCENDRGTPGTGHINWNEVKQSLKKIGYDRFAVIESFTFGVKEIARAAALWRPLEKDEDTLAKNGLTFLRELFA
ncbi:MAG: sugar phosphate isomerase/epimerase [Candidatus Atribacteria bacterium]|nr:sugar phosphate isomerase/epimerase [Candidatus Atribacteria bacterium]